VALVLVLPPFADADASPQILPPGQVTNLAGPVVLLVAPVDGRLRGPDFMAQVTGVAWPGAVGSAPNRYVASRGRRIVVFDLRLAQPSSSVNNSASSTLTAHATVTTGVANSEAVDLSTIDSAIVTSAPPSGWGTGTGTFAVSVPIGDHDVHLVISEGSFTQTFSLWTLKREAPTPDILYRDPRSATVVANPVSGATIPITNPADGFTQDATIAVKQAELTAFLPDGSNSPVPSTREAFLAVSMTAQYPNVAYSDPGWGHVFDNLNALPGSAVTFSFPGSQPVAATAINVIAPSQQVTANGNGGLLDAIYVFTVPASTAAGTLSIGPAVTTGIEDVHFTGGTAVPVQVGGPVTLALSFPSPPTTVPVQLTPPWVSEAAPTAGADGISSVGGSANLPSGGFNFWLLAVLVGFVLAVLATIAQVRRSRGSPLRNRPDPYRPLRPQVLPPGRLPPALLAGALVDEGDEPLRDQRNQAGDPFAGNAESGVPSETIVGVGAPAREVPTEHLASGLEVLVLGPVEISGWAVSPRRTVVSALACYLTFHPDRPVSADQLEGGLWPIGRGRPGPTRATLHTYLSELRTALGPGVLPDSTTKGGYQLMGTVTDDWSTFAWLEAEARDADPIEAIRLRSQALSLVRGPPFQGASADTFEWASTEQFISTMEVAITECAHAQTLSYLDARDHARAREAVEIGLFAVPDSFVLHADLVRTAQANGDPAELRRAQRRARNTLGDDEAERLFEGSAPSI